MRVAPGQHRAYSYRVIVPPVNLPITVELFKAHIKKLVTTPIEDELITTYIEAATAYAENVMRRDLITRTYETTRDFFPDGYSHEGYYNGCFKGNVGFEIRRSPLQAVSEVKYLVNGAQIIVDPLTYYNTVEDDYSEVLTADGVDWPDDADQQLQSIAITFTCGFGDDPADIPNDIQAAILSHATSMWANRGDCGGCDGSSGVSPSVKMVYLSNRLELL